jgi:hypothetical protein
MGSGTVADTGSTLRRWRKSSKLLYIARTTISILPKPMTRLPLFLAASALLAGCASAPTQTPLTTFTSNSGNPRAPEQLAVSFEKADLALRVDPATQSISGDAALTFRTSAPLTRIAVELDRNLPLSFASVDGVALAPTAISNTDGRLYLTLPTPLAAGVDTTVRIRYSGVPHVAKRAPWDGGFRVEQNAGRPALGPAPCEGEGCDLFWPCIDHPTRQGQAVDSTSPCLRPWWRRATASRWAWMRKTAGAPITGARRIRAPTASRSTSALTKCCPANSQPLRQQDPAAHVVPAARQASREGLFAEFTPMLDLLRKHASAPTPSATRKMGVVETPHKGMEHQTINAYGNKYARRLAATTAAAA